MCIIALKRKDHTFSPKLVERMYDLGNRDGAGMMWVENGRVKTLKTMGSYKEIMKLYEENMHRDIAIHVRNASYGMEKNLENCHPFCVLDKDLGHKMDLYVMHNGRINDIQVNKKMSDSYNFATEYLRGILSAHPTLIYDKSFQFFLGGLISPNNNKLVFLDNKNNFIVINSDLGAIHPSGVWVSTKSEIKEFSYVANTSPSTTTYHLGSSAKKERKGNWESDSDGRLHFMPNLVPAADDKVEDITDDQAEAGIGSGTTNSAEQDVLAELLSKIPDMKRADIYKFIIDYPQQAVSMLSQLSGESKNKTKKFIKTMPWEAVDRLVGLTNKELKNAATA